MSKTLTEEKMKSIVNELAENYSIESQSDLSSLTNGLRKAFIEKALNIEMDEHLGYSKNSVSGNNTGNSRNGVSEKIIKGDHGESAISIPRDREGCFEPQLIKKHQTRLTEFDDKVLCLYAKGMSTRDIVQTFKEMYGASVSATMISKITDAVLEDVSEWRNRPLEPVYPIVYMDCIVLKIRQDGRVINKAIYLALGINLDGKKEVLGLWISENEGAKFWLSVLTELQNRGVQDIFIACVDGLTGFPDAINTAFPKAKIQLCIVHMVRNSLRFVSYKDYKAVTANLKSIYAASTEEVAKSNLECFAEKWDGQYPSISKIWYKHWENLNTFFDYPDDIRKAIYTTNAIESLNSVIRKATKNKKVFPSEQSAMKVVYLAIQSASKKWTMPIRDWKAAMNRFLIDFEDRLSKFI